MPDSNLDYHTQLLITLQSSVQKKRVNEMINYRFFLVRVRNSTCASKNLLFLFKNKNKKCVKYLEGYDGIDMSDCKMVHFVNNILRSW